MAALPNEEHQQPRLALAPDSAHVKAFPISDGLGLYSRGLKPRVEGGRTPRTTVFDVATGRGFFAVGRVAYAPEELPQQMLCARRVRLALMDLGTEGICEEQRHQPRPGGRARWGGRHRTELTVGQKQTVD